MKKKTILFALAAFVASCHKAPNEQPLTPQSPIPSAQNGCVTCTIKGVVRNSNGTLNDYYKYDTSICNISDSSLKFFIKMNNYHEQYIPKSDSLFVTTTCK